MPTPNHLLLTRLRSLGLQQGRPPNHTLQRRPLRLTMYPQSVSGESDAGLTGDSEGSVGHPGQGREGPGRL